jgi:hypothetical protein
VFVDCVNAGQALYNDHLYNIERDVSRCIHEKNLA